MPGPAPLPAPAGKCHSPRPVRRPRRGWFRPSSAGRVAPPDPRSSTHGPPAEWRLPLVPPDLTRVAPAPAQLRSRIAPKSPGRWIAVILALLVAGAAVGSAAVAVDAVGAGRLWGRLVARVDRALHPVPDRPTLPTITITPRP